MSDQVDDSVCKNPHSLIDEKAPSQSRDTTDKEILDNIIIEQLDGTTNSQSCSQFDNMTDPQKQGTIPTDDSNSNNFGFFRASTLTNKPSRNQFLFNTNAD